MKDTYAPADALNSVSAVCRCPAMVLVYVPSLLCLMNAMLPLKLVSLVSGIGGLLCEVCVVGCLDYGHTFGWVSTETYSVTDRCYY